MPYVFRSKLSNRPVIDAVISPKHVVVPPIICLDDAVRHNLVRHDRRQSCRRRFRNSPVSLISMDNISTASARPRIGMASPTARAASRLPFQPTTTRLPIGRALQVRFLYGTAFSLARISLSSTLNLLDWLYMPFWAWLISNADRRRHFNNVCRLGHYGFTGRLRDMARLWGCFPENR